MELLWKNDQSELLSNGSSVPITTSSSTPASTCVALTTRVSYYEIKDDKHPRWVQACKIAACSHTAEHLSTLPDEPKTRNEHKRIALWLIQDHLSQLERYYRHWWMYRYEKDPIKKREWKPHRTKKDLMLQLESAWRYYCNWAEERMNT